MDVIRNPPTKLVVDTISTLNEILLLSSQWIISSPEQTTTSYSRFAPSALVTTVGYAIMEPLAYWLIPKFPAPRMFFISAVLSMHYVMFIIYEEILSHIITKEENRAEAEHESLPIQTKETPEVQIKIESSNSLPLTSRACISISALLPTTFTAMSNAWLLLFGQSLETALWPESRVFSQVLPVLMLCMYIGTRMTDFRIGTELLRSRYLAERGMAELPMQILHLALLVGLRSCVREAMGLPVFMGFGYIDPALPREDFNIEKYPWMQKYHEILPKWAQMAMSPVSILLTWVGFYFLDRHRKQEARAARSRAETLAGEIRIA